jgi:DNA repair exonuclease SbcCD ATPase subunit
MPASVTAIERFTQLKKKRDALSNQLATLQGKLDSSRDRYNDILRELQTYNIGSLDELKREIANLDEQIEQELSQAEVYVAQLEEELAAVEVS